MALPMVLGQFDLESRWPWPQIVLLIFLNGQEVGVAVRSCEELATRRFQKFLQSFIFFMFNIFTV